MVSLQKIGLTLTILGLITIALSQAMPLIKQPQSATWKGPKVGFTRERFYWIDQYLTPPIDKGVQMRIALNSSKPGNTSILIFPSTPNGDPVGSSVVSMMFAQGRDRLDMITMATHTAHYMVMVTSWNSTYMLTISAEWSPFNDARMALLPGAILTGGGLLVYYYGRVKAYLRRMYSLRP